MTSGGTEKYARCGRREEDLGELRREAPIVLETPFDITLDWFLDDRAGGSRFKTWAGRQSVLDIASAMKDALIESATGGTTACLMFSVAGCGLPFNFDSDLGGQGGASTSGSASTRSGVA